MTNSKEMVTVHTVCPFCGKSSYIDVPFDGYMAWKHNGVCIQNAMPDVPAYVSELLISGICLACQDSIFSEPDEPDDDEDVGGCYRESLEFTGQWW